VKQLVNISDEASVAALLAGLSEISQPVFGAMTSRHMVEHLVFSLKFSNGKAPQRVHYPDRIADKIKSVVIGSEAMMPEGFKSPVLPKDGLPPLAYPDLAGAIAQLFTELGDFHAYFAADPDNTPVNPTMGALTHSEWIRFHNKHFTHHFRQFNLI
jgi:hypothetical protein